jgi:hypothetical protein
MKTLLPNGITNALSILLGAIRRSHQVAKLQPGGITAFQ